MISAKQQVQYFISALKEHGISRVVISPGSRNAPLSLSFMQDDFFKVYVIADERAAAFFALGLSLSDLHPTVITCTSGTAGLNYAPALAEAYYQRVPVLAATADRPPFSINQKDGQAINQHEQFANFCLYSETITDYSEEQRMAERKISAGLAKLFEPLKGPVHLNFAFGEPLYEQAEVFEQKGIFLSPIKEALELRPQEKELFASLKKVLIIVGQHHPKEGLQSILSELEKKFEDVAFFFESTSNSALDSGMYCIDRFIDPISEAEKVRFTPDLVITTSGALISKKIKAYFKRNKPKHHWHVGKEHGVTDMFDALTTQFNVSESTFFNALLHVERKPISHFRTEVQRIDLNRRQNHNEFLASLPYSDFLIFRDTVALLKQHKRGIDVHLANSTPVRYWQLFDTVGFVENCFSNRGVSGIDGSLSTAFGYAQITNRLQLVITGDLSFFYDSNAFWNDYKTNNMIVLLLNNGGGDIFSIIPGPEQTKNYEHSFKAKHSTKAEGIAYTFGWQYSRVENAEGFNTKFNEILLNTDNRPTILEVDTQPVENASFLKNYFAFLKQNAKE